MDSNLFDLELFRFVRSDVFDQSFFLSIRRLRRPVLLELRFSTRVRSRCHNLLRLDILPALFLSLRVALILILLLLRRACKNREPETGR